jgi:hypothetical protein
MRIYGIPQEQSQSQRILIIKRHPDF